MSKKKADKEKVTHKTCSKCSNDKHITKDFYTAPNDRISADGRMTICKACLRDLVPDFNNAEELVDILRTIDRPFLRNLYESSLEKDNPWGNYMTVLAAHQNATKTYADSEFTKDLEKLQMDTTIVSIKEQKDDNELLRTWGVYTAEQYDYLEGFYEEYDNNQPAISPQMVALYRNIAKTHLQADIELGKSNTKNYKDLMDLSMKLHKDAGISPSQTSGAEDKGLHTYGMWIEDIERTEPCEYFEGKPVYADFDGFKQYWEKWFIRPFKNIFGISRDVGDDGK